MAKYTALVLLPKLANVEVVCAPFSHLLTRAYTVTVGAKNAPPKPRKSPLSAYQIFVKEKAMSNTNDNENPADRFKRVAAEWKDMTEADKSIYHERYILKHSFVF